MAIKKKVKHECEKIYYAESNVIEDDFDTFYIYNADVAGEHFVPKDRVAVFKLIGFADVVSTFQVEMEEC